MGNGSSARVRLLRAQLCFMRAGELKVIGCCEESGFRLPEPTFRIAHT